MEESEVKSLMQSMTTEGNAELVETHISWVILSHDHAYKIKKPVRFSFLDFSTMALRAHACLQEVELNRRLTQDMYLGIKPIYKHGEGVSFDGHDGEVIDYAVQMRRYPQERQMDEMLRAHAVTPVHVEQIAQQLAVFHRDARRIDEPPDTTRMLQDFADLSQVAEQVASAFGVQGTSTIEAAVRFARKFLHLHAQRIRERHALGYVVDGHGDLHSKNIFLLDTPVIFDCIEFNDHYRAVDVLDELAFFCLDLDLYDRADLAVHFLDHYQSLYPCMPTREDHLLFRYFKLYRAGVKLKINCIKYANTADTSDRRFRYQRMEAYFDVFSTYLQTFEDMV